MSLITAPDFFILRGDPPPATRSQTRRITTQLIDELRRSLREHQIKDHKFPRPAQNEQQQMADFALRVLQIPKTETTAIPDLECDEATIRVAIALYEAIRKSHLVPTPDRYLWNILTRDAAALDEGTVREASIFISRFSTEPAMWYIITPEDIVNSFDVYRILYDHSRRAE